MQFRNAAADWRIETTSDSASSQTTLDTLCRCAYTESETAGEKPKFHYEVHHVLHKFGHRTPASVKLREVTRHAATGSDDDDDDDDEEEDNNLVPADGGHVISGGADTLPEQFDPVDTPVRSQRPVAGGR